LRTGKDAVDLISAASEHRAALILFPVERFGDQLFDLSTHIAGEILQKFATYGCTRRDSREHLAPDCAKKPAAFVSESNSGDHVWFVKTLEQLEERL